MSCPPCRVPAEPAAAGLEVTPFSRARQELEEGKSPGADHEYKTNAQNRVLAPTRSVRRTIPRWQPVGCARGSRPYRREPTTMRADSTLASYLRTVCPDADLDAVSGEALAFAAALDVIGEVAPEIAASIRN